MNYASRFVELLLAAAAEQDASDVHLQPSPAGLDVRWRIDGVLHSVGTFPRGEAADVVSRLKVLAGLLTYRADVPQEGRLGRPAAEQPKEPSKGQLKTIPNAVEMRISTFPTLYGERAVIRRFAAEHEFHFPRDLGLPAEIEASLLGELVETSGALLITGPAGSGKTTTVYACLRQLATAGNGQRSLVSLEDPVEVAVPGVAQSQVNPAAGFDLATGLRSLLRQDPEVILVGEIRDRPTAEAAFQAALTGHLILSTFHAGTAAGALSRLMDMGIEPYLLRSGLRAIVNQRLVRRLCSCAEPIASDAAKLGLAVSSAKQATGCDACSHVGYRGRLVLAEMLPPLDGELAAAVLARSDSRKLQAAALAAGMTTLFARALQCVEAGATDPAEVRRVLGFSAGNATVES
jgi:type II secretory ATPase GspE/PulE/Tfp pilus assembly ATPase PilB-like protein